MELYSFMSVLVLPCLILVDHVQRTQGKRAIVVSVHSFRNASREQKPAVAPSPLMEGNLTAEVSCPDTTVPNRIADAKFESYIDKLHGKGCKLRCNTESCKAALKLGTGYQPGRHFHKDVAYAALLEELPNSGSSKSNPPYDYEILLSVSTLLGVRDEKLDRHVPGIAIRDFAYLPLQVPFIGFQPVYDKVIEMLDSASTDARTHAIIFEGLAILVHLTYVSGGSAVGWTTKFETKAELDHGNRKIRDLLHKYSERLVTYPHVKQVTDWITQKDRRVQKVLVTSSDWLLSNSERMTMALSGAKIAYPEPSEEFLAEMLKNIASM